MIELSSLELQHAVDTIFDECKDLMFKKNADYNPSGIAFEGVDAMASIIDVSSYKVIYLLLFKHLEAIRAFIQHGKLESSESLEGRIQDAINYLALLSIDIHKRKHITNDK